jgi:hypothetical protein
MRAQEFVTELVTRAETTDHLLKRLTYAAQLCATMGDTPLIFREFKTGISQETVLAKVINDDSRLPLKGGIGRTGQDKIIDILGIKHPVFTKLRPPTRTFGFHGDPHIFIPKPGSTSFYSLEVEDLGGQRLTSDPEIVQRNGKVISGGRFDNMARELAATYIKGVPKTFIENEIIFDTSEYYLLNIQSFLSRFAGKENKASLTKNSIWLNIDPAVWSNRIRTYNDASSFLINNGVSYVKWYQTNVEKK